MSSTQVQMPMSKIRDWSRWKKKKQLLIPYPTSSSKGKGRIWPDFMKLNLDLPSWSSRVTEISPYTSFKPLEDSLSGVQVEEQLELKV